MSETRQARRVALTGIGIICPLGITAPECWENMVEGRSGIGPITRFDASDCVSRIAGQIPDSCADAQRERLSAEFLSRNTYPARLAFMTAAEAIEDSKLDIAASDLDRVAVITGCGGSAFGDVIRVKQTDGRPVAYPYEMLNALGANVCLEYGFRGPCYNIAAACASGAFAAHAGYDYVLKTGGACIVIGVETMLHRPAVDAFGRLMALSDRNDCPAGASRPFDKHRNGFVISEGSGAVVLEDYDRALSRGARIYAAMTGAATTSEAHNIVAPEPEGREMARTIDAAIRNAGIPRERIAYINAHGTSTVLNDRAETMAIKHVFGEKAYGIPISSQKSMIGHSIGAAGAIELAVTALTLFHGVITPTINYETPDPECDLDYVPNTARRGVRIEAAISNSFGFGGHNATLVLTKLS